MPPTPLADPADVRAAIAALATIHDDPVVNTIIRQFTALVRDFGRQGFSPEAITCAFGCIVAGTPEPYRSQIDAVIHACDIVTALDGGPMEVEA